MQYRDGQMKRDGSFRRDGSPTGNTPKQKQEVPPVWGIPETGRIAAECGDLLVCNSCQTPVLTVVKTLHKNEIKANQISPTFFKFLDGQDVPVMMGIQCPHCFLTSPDNQPFSSLCITSKDKLEKFENKFSTATVPQIIGYLFTGPLKDHLRRRKEVELCQKELLKRIQMAPENIVPNSRNLEHKPNREIANGLFIQLNQKSKTVAAFTIQKHEAQDKLQEYWQEYKNRLCFMITQKVIDGDVTPNQLLAIVKNETGDESMAIRIQKIIQKEMEKKRENEE